MGGGGGGERNVCIGIIVPLEKGAGEGGKWEGGGEKPPREGVKKKRDKCYCNGKQTEVCIVVWV